MISSITVRKLKLINLFIYANIKNKWLRDYYISNIKTIYNNIVKNYKRILVFFKIGCLDLNHTVYDRERERD